MCVTLGLCLLHLPYPFSFDQALFMAAARDLSEGAHMYGAFWDLKQPGIYWWNELAGQLFGFDSLGIRIMDTCWAVAVALLLWLLLRSRSSLIAALGPMFALASFYAVAEPWMLSQVEWLVGAPLAALMWCLCNEGNGEPSSVARYGLAGIMLAGVLLLKLILIPVAGLMLLIALAQDHWVRQRSWASIIKRQIAPATVGFLVLLAPVLLYMQAVGTLGTAVWTTFVDPGEVLREYPHHKVHMLFSSLRWFLRTVWYLVPWAAWGAYTGLRQGSRLVWMLAAWISVGFAAVAIQVLSYWPYHFDLFYIPVGMLAAIGVGDAWTWATARQAPSLRWAIAGALIVCLAMGLALPLSRKTHGVAVAHAFPIDRHDLLAATREFGGPKELVEAAAAVRGLTHDGDRIVSWGDARMYFLTGRRPLVEIDGGTSYLTSQLATVAEVILKQRPALIFISKYRDPDVTYHGGGLIPRTVEENYTRYFENEAGVWYRPRHAETGT